MTRFRAAARLAGFRLACVYLLLYNFPVIGSGVVPGLEWLGQPCAAFWAAVVPWAARLLGFPTLAAADTGSGDRLFDYIQVGCILVLSLAGAALWTALDRRRGAYKQLPDWLRVYVRYSLACAMLGYGFIKVFKLQFPSPSPLHLLQSYGESSPMGLLWKFMGYSTPYNVFVGSIEIAGGLLLFYRRTATLGSLIVIGSMAHVVALNFCYDVPVKLYSLHLLAMGVFLAWPDLPRLARMLVLNEPVPAAALEPAFPRPWMNRHAPLVRDLFMGLVLSLNVKSSLEQYRAHGDSAPRHYLYGAYEVESGTPADWRRLGVDNDKRLLVKLDDGSLARYLFEDDVPKQTLELTSFDDRKPQGRLRFRLLEGGGLMLAGRLQDRPVDLRLRKIPESQWLLKSRGFHWINEFPYNR